MSQYGALTAHAALALIMTGHHAHHICSVRTHMQEQHTDKLIGEMYSWVSNSLLKAQSLLAVQ